VRPNSFFFFFLISFFVSFITFDLEL
jgi:hypothetical protein